MKRIYVWSLVAVMAGASPALALDVKVSVKGEQLAFEPDHFDVKAGEKVKLTFVNPSKNMPHNWVLGKPGTGAKIGAEGQNAGEKNDYVAKGPDVLANTKIVPPSKGAKPSSTTITFTAPTEKGAYPYVCSFPGHWVVMKGTMNVQ